MPRFWVIRVIDPISGNFVLARKWGVVYASSWLNPILQDARGFLMAVAQRLPQGGRLPHERAGTQENAHRPCAPHARREAQGLIIKIPRIGSVFKQEFYQMRIIIARRPYESGIESGGFAPPPASNVAPLFGHRSIPLQPFST